MAVPQILAVTFTVAFEGLMMFQGNPDGSKHVAIVNASCYYNHDDPRIEVWRPQSPGGQLKLVPSFPLKLQTGDAVSFGVTGTVIHDPDGLYVEHMPNINDFIVQGHVDSHVVNHSTVPDDDGVLAFVALPPGSLTTFGTFAEKVQLTGTPRKYCFARYVILKADTATTIPTIAVHHSDRTLGADPAPVQLEQNDLVIISNSSMDDTHSHFPAYSRLLDKTGNLGPILFPQNETCDKTHSAALDPIIAKKLTDMHFLIPHGDCGPINNP